MKSKYMIFTAAAVFLLSACSKEDTKPAGEAGYLTVAANVNTQTTDKSHSRATSTDIADYRIMITPKEGGENVYNESMPRSGKTDIIELAAAEYSVTVTSHPQGIPAPDFDMPVYRAIHDLSIQEGARRDIEIVCRQANAGVLFTYDSSVSEYRLLPQVKHPEGTLEYPVNDGDATGYYAPGIVSVSFTHDGQSISINGYDDERFTLGAGELWNLHVSLTADGGIRIDAQVITVDEPNNSEKWIIGGSDEDRMLNRHGSLTYYGGENASEVIVDFYNDDYTLNMYLRLFTTKADFEDIDLTPGNYRMVSFDEAIHGEPMTFVAGFYDKQNTRLYPSHLAEYENGLESGTTAAWMPTVGSLVVEKEDQTYTVTATFSGVHYDFLNGGAESFYQNVTWLYSGSLNSWRDNSPKEGSTEISEVREGLWNAQGTPSYLDPPGMDSWSFSLTNTNRYFTISDFAGLGCPAWIDWEKGFFYMDTQSVLNQYFTSEQTQNHNAYFCAVAFDDDYAYMSRSHPVKFDKDNQVFDFSGTMTVTNPDTGVSSDREVHVGIIAVNKTTGRFDGSFSDLYTGFKLSYSDTRSGQGVMTKCTGIVYNLPDGKSRKIIITDHEHNIYRRRYQVE